MSACLHLFSTCPPLALLRGASLHPAFGFLALWLFGFLASWLLGFLASWLLGFSASWLPGFSAFWLLAS